MLRDTTSIFVTIGVRFETVWFHHSFIEYQLIAFDFCLSFDLFSNIVPDYFVRVVDGDTVGGCLRFGDFLDYIVL